MLWLYHSGKTLLHLINNCLYVYSGKVGLSVNVNWAEPLDEINPSHWTASEVAMQWYVGALVNPFLGNGDYPQAVKDAVKDILGIEYLPVFNSSEIKENKGNSISFFLLQICL